SIQPGLKAGPITYSHYNLHPSGTSTYLQQLWRLTSLTDVLSPHGAKVGPVPSHYNLGPSGDTQPHPFSLAPKVGPVPTHYNLHPSGDSTYLQQLWRLTSLTNVLFPPHGAQSGTPQPHPFSLAPKVGPVPTHYNLHPSGDSTYLQQLWRLTSLTGRPFLPMEPKVGPVPSQYNLAQVETVTTYNNLAPNLSPVPTCYSIKINNITLFLKYLSPTTSIQPGAQSGTCTYSLQSASKWRQYLPTTIVATN
ncbi:hypothetical protein CDAR_109431, partial [Caerostris darwini]